MFKSVWTFERTDEQFSDYDELRRAIEDYVDNNDVELEYWVNDEFGNVDICGINYDAFDIIAKMGDFSDAAESFVEYLMDNEVEEDEVEVGYVFDGVRYDSLKDAEAAAEQFAIENYDKYIAESKGDVFIMGKRYTVAELIKNLDKVTYFSELTEYIANCKLMIDEFEGESEDDDDDDD